jgi:ribosome recycling factor
MATDSREQLERVGRHYDREQMLSVRKMTLDAIDRIARAVKPGMLEEDAVAQGRKILKLSAVNFAPTTDLWVLEIQIRHPGRQIGAFYEDLLLDQVTVP